MLEREIFDLVMEGEAIGVKTKEVVVSDKTYLLSERIIIHRKGGDEKSLILVEGDSGDTIESVSSQSEYQNCDIKFIGPFSGIYFKKYFGNVPYDVGHGEITEISISGKSGILHVKVGDISNLLFGVGVESNGFKT